MGTAFPLADPSISGQLPGSRVTGNYADGVGRLGPDRCREILLSLAISKCDLAAGPELFPGDHQCTVSREKISAYFDGSQVKGDTHTNERQPRQNLCFTRRVAIREVVRIPQELATICRPAKLVLIILWS